MDKVNLDHHRTYFPFILVGLSVLLAVGLYAFYSSRPSGPSGPSPFQGEDRWGSESETMTPTHDGYVAATASVIAAFQADQNAQRAYDQLIQITVPTADQGTHLELVIIFGKFLAGETVIAEARYQALKQTITWLP